MDFALTFTQVYAWACARTHTHHLLCTPCTRCSRSWFWPHHITSGTPQDPELKTQSSAQTWKPLPSIHPVLKPKLQSLSAHFPLLIQEKAPSYLSLCVLSSLLATGCARVVLSLYDHGFTLQWNENLFCSYSCFYLLGPWRKGRSCV